MSQSDFTDPYLRKRYGIKAARYPSWVAPALVIALTGGGWLFWSASHYSKPETRATLIAFQARSASEMELRYSLIFRSAAKSHACRLVARDYSANVVGEITDEIPAGLTSVTRTVAIPTRLLAVNAAVVSCSP